MQPKNRKTSPQQQEQRFLPRKTSPQQQEQRKALLDLAAARLVKILDLEESALWVTSQAGILKKKICLKSPET